MARYRQLGLCLLCCTRIPYCVLGQTPESGFGLIVLEICGGLSVILSSTCRAPLRGYKKVSRHNFRCNFRWRARLGSLRAARSRHTIEREIYEAMWDVRKASWKRLLRLAAEGAMLIAILSHAADRSGLRKEAMGAKSFTNMTGQEPNRTSPKKNGLRADRGKIGRLDLSSLE